MGKKFVEVKKMVDSRKLYSIAEAVELAKKTSFTKFDASIEVAFKLNLDTTKSDQQLRGSIALPYYFGKDVRVLVIDDTMTKEKAASCKANFFGGVERIAEIKDG
jgi:large subunit ribosomal protein L1